MTSDHLKKLVEQIQKTAQVPGRSKGEKVAPVAPAAGGGTAPAAKPANSVPQRGGHPAPTGHPVGVTTNPAIKQMQIAMQNLAKLISNTINYDQLMASMNQPATADKKDFTKSFGRDAFSNFMVNRYLRNSTTKGVEYDTDPKKSKMTQKSPAELKNMFIILDGLRRIGPGSKEFAADGVWGPRTNNGLKNVAAIAESVMKLGKDLGMEARTFDASKLSTLTPLIPNSDEELKALSIKDKSERAAQLTPLLNGVQSLFKEFQHEVLQNPAYRSFIDEAEPLFKVGPKKQGLNLEDSEKKIYQELAQPNSRYNAPLASVSISAQLTGGKQVPPFSITGSDLLNKQTFDNWVNKNSVLMNLKNSNPDTWNTVVKTILDQTKQQIAKKLTSQPQQDVPPAAPPQGTPV